MIHRLRKQHTAPVSEIGWHFIVCRILYRYGQLLLQVVSETNNRGTRQRRGSTVPYPVCWHGREPGHTCSTWRRLHRPTWRRVVSCSMYRAVTSQLVAISALWNADWPRALTSCRVTCYTVTVISVFVIAFIVVIREKSATWWPVLHNQNHAEGYTHRWSNGWKRKQIDFTATAESMQSH